jgi:hypothetical protein
MAVLSVSKSRETISQLRDDYLALRQSIFDLVNLDLAEALDL